MVYLLGTIANDADHMPSLLWALANELEPPAVDPQETWGVGYYADDRALIIRKPVELLNQRSAFQLAPEVMSRIVVAAAHGGASREHSPPFRFRRWLFAFNGNLDPLLGLRAKILDKLPDFVRTELREASGGELAFGMLLAELHRANLLDDTLAEGQALAGAVARTVDTIGRLVTEAGTGSAQASYVATNGRLLLVARSGIPVAWKVQQGLDSLPEGPPDPALTDFKQIAAALKRFRAVVVAAGAPRPGWTEVGEGKVLTIDAKLQIRPGV